MHTNNRPDFLFVLYEPQNPSVKEKELQLADTRAHVSRATRLSISKRRSKEKGHTHHGDRRVLPKYIRSSLRILLPKVLNATKPERKVDRDEDHSDALQCSHRLRPTHPRGLHGPALVRNALLHRFQNFPKPLSIQTVFDRPIHDMDGLSDGLSRAGLIVDRAFGVNSFSRWLIDMVNDTEINFFAMGAMVLAATQAFREPATSLPTRFFEYTGRAISLLRQKLEMPDATADDSAIMAILLFATTEYVLGHLERYAIHKRQLSQMAAARGGIANFSRDSVVKIAVQK